jgi:phenylalanyl-tRNA synthetase beta chain
MHGDSRLKQYGSHYLARNDIFLYMRGIVVGLVTSVRSHPRGDLIRIANVDIGASEQIEIVFGGPDNVNPGSKVPVALPGAIMANGSRMRAKTFRGVKSMGMLCSSNELGWAKDAPDEVMILPGTWEVGSSLIPGCLSGEHTVRLPRRSTFRR